MVYNAQENEIPWAKKQYGERESMQRIGGINQAVTAMLG